MRILKAGVVAALLVVATTNAAAPAAAEPASSGSGWQSRVTREIAESEYHLSVNAATGSFTAPNRAHDFRARWSPDGALAIESRTAPGTWSFSYRLVGVGRGAAVLTVPEVRRENVGEGRIEWDHDGIREWYVNDGRGIEQGFDLESRPAGNPRDPLIIEGAIEGLLAFPAGDGQSVVFRTPAGRDAMRMRDISVVDASGTVVPACFEAGIGTLALVIYDRDAVYPLTVDPLMTSPAWTAESNQADAEFGASVATAGDVNGDGYADAIVGAHMYDNGESDEGRAFVYLGSASGLATTSAWTTEGNLPNADLGKSVATAGDVNGDGYSDVIVGVPGYDNGEVDEGHALVYMGSASGLALNAAWAVESNQDYALLGESVATAGDVNADGYTDVIVGAPPYDNGAVDEGIAFLYLGSASGLATNAAWSAESNQAGARLGSVATAGDVNGDGYADVILGARLYDNGESDEGRAFVYLGSASGLATTAAWTAESDRLTVEFGRSVGTAGDVNGDGYADVVVGAPWADAATIIDQGRAFLYLGSATGLATSPAWTAEISQAGALFGDAVATAGDVNGDGYADVVVTAPYSENGEVAEGRAFVYLGSASGLAPVAAWNAESNQDRALFGASVATAGDVNGDGFSDIIVGAPWYDNGEMSEGRAFVYHGSASGLAAVESWTDESNQTSAGFGGSVATAGDVNGDGYSDVIVGAPGYDNGEAYEGRAFLYLGSVSGLTASPAWTAESNQVDAQFGYPVATAGDVNGDGYSDVIIGATQYDNGETDEGRATVYLGSPSGLATTAAWTAEDNQAEARFGWSVATAGDVNGDGFSDVIVGAPMHDNGEINEGRAYAYLGSTTGLTTTAAWAVESNQPNSQFGASVATAGDVNGDGYSDMVVGAPSHGTSIEGRAFLFLGSVSGPTTTATWIAVGDHAESAFGGSVATAGDVNGDGYSDVIVGANHDRNNQSGEGRAFVYLGSPSGLSASATWTADGNQPFAAFGYSVATAGDVNGDGYSDVIVGAIWFDNGESDEGRAFVYLGSSSGLSTTPAWTAESNQVDPWFGACVASAGDVNGDGYSDVIVGAFQYDNGESEEGRVFLYYGNDKGGLDRIPRQARADGSAPIDLLGATTAANGFRLRANGRSPFGRDQVRLEWEVKPVATPFDGAAIQASNWFDTGAPGASGSVVPLDELHASLAGPGPFHWRLRLRSRSPFPWQSHWMGLPYNAITETDLRTENILARCDLGFADLTFPPLTPTRVAPWVYTQTCAGGDVLPALLWPSIVSGTDVDTLAASPGTLRFYQLSCGCTDGIYLTKRAGQVRLDLF